MKRPLTPTQRRKLLNASETREFQPPTDVETLRDQMDLGTYKAAGWIAPAHLSDDGWLKTGTALAGVERAVPWWWGDWWNTRKIGRKLPKDWAGPSLSTLGSYATVAKVFPISRRLETVSFGHHAELTSLSEAEQDSLLNWCNAADRPSVMELRAEKQRRAAAKLPPPKPPPRIEPPKVTPPPAVLKVEPPLADIAIPVTLFVPEELHTWAREAADNEHMPLGAWIVRLIARARDE